MSINIIGLLDHADLIRKMEEVKRLIDKNPNLRFINLRRNDGSIVDVPLRDVRSTLTVNPQWTIAGSDKVMDEKMEELFKEVVDDMPETPIEGGPDEDVSLLTAEEPPKKRGRPKKNA